MAWSLLKKRESEIWFWVTEEQQQQKQVRFKLTDEMLREESLSGIFSCICAKREKAKAFNLPFSIVLLQESIQVLIYIYFTF